MSNICTFNKGDYAYFDVEGISNRPETYVVQIVRRKNKSRYVVMSLDTNEIFETDEKLLLPYIDKDIVTKMESRIKIVRNSDQTCYVDSADISSITTIGRILKKVQELLVSPPEDAAGEDLKEVINDSLNHVISVMDEFLVPKLAMIAKRNTEFDNVRNTIKRINLFNEKVAIYNSTKLNELQTCIDQLLDHSDTYFGDTDNFFKFMSEVGREIINIANGDHDADDLLEICEKLGPISISEMNRGKTIRADIDPRDFNEIVTQLITANPITKLVIVPYWDSNSNKWGYGIFGKDNINQFFDFAIKHFSDTLPYKPIIIPIMGYEGFRFKDGEEDE